MTAFTIRRPSRRPLVVVIGVLAIAIGTQVASVWNGDQAGLDEPLLAAPPAAEIDADAGPIGAAPVRTPPRSLPRPARSPARARTPPAGRPRSRRPDPRGPGSRGPGERRPQGFDPTAELARIRADVDFWAARLTAHPNDIVSAVKLAESDVAEARMTGDVTAYLRAEQAADAAIVAQPGYLPAQSMRASILVSLHRFPQARELARWILFRSPADSTALGVLGDASLELGDLTTAATAYSRLALVADGSAAQVRAARLAFVEGDPAAAVAGDRTAVASATAGGPRGRRARLLPRHAGRDAHRRRRRGRCPVGVRGGPRGPSGPPGGPRRAGQARRVRRRPVGRDRRARHGDRRDPAARLAGAPGRPADPPRGGGRRPQGPGGHGHGRGDRAARRRGRLRLRPRPVPVPVRPRPRARARGQAGPRRARHPARRLRLRHPRLGAPQRGRRRRRRRADAVRPRGRHQGRPALVPRRADRPRQRTSRRGRHRPPQRARPRAGPGPDGPRSGRPTPWRRSDEVARPRRAPRHRPGARARAGRRGRRPGAPARQLHDQPLRGDPRRAVAGAARRRHRRGRDPDVPGEPGLRPRRRRGAVGGRDGGGARVDLRVGGPGPEPDRRRDRRAAGPDRGRARVPAGQRRPVDDAQRLHATRLRSRHRSSPARRSRSRTASRRPGSAGAR